MRDPAVDLIRAVAVVGVIAGHWLVTALVAGPDGLTVQSPLRWMPDLAPVSWLLQTLGLFFFAGGFAAARSKTGLWHKVRRLAIPVAIVLLVWGLVIAASTMPRATASSVIHLVVSPLWFLGVYVVLQALTPVFRWLDEQLGAWAIFFPVALSVTGELSLSEINVLAVWWAPWQAGMVMARVGLRPKWGLPLLTTGAVAYFLLVTFAGFPVSAVGGTGEPRSNLAPPSLAALALAAAQIGLALLLARPIRWRITNWINRHALALFLLHQSALLTIILPLNAFGIVPGLHASPDHPTWLLARAMWLPAFAIALVAWVLVFRKVRLGQTSSAASNH
ncbi:acyltransferase family protein [Kibdelosporangium philippinense]|uniref:Acyltransferase family protein n=1 Tax=Kibdelosporangium philippinense TaxID=211113 RepID=A0ABS8Z6L3_9PSEU|nr:acyltransferase family protein [Kibdelosporangium philippinense]MCE7003455.1 acyltransferase family protein [Kibdelosporangium philippinense]